MKAIVEYTNSHYIKKIVATDKYSAITELTRVFENTDICSDLDGLVHTLIEREKIMSTGIGFGIAIPHAKIESVKKLSFAIGFSPEGINFDSIDGKPVRLIILVAAGENQHKDYLGLLSGIMSLLKDENFKNQIINSTDSVDVIKLLEKKGR